MKRIQKMTLIGEKIQCPINDFRKKWLKKGFELINITSLCELKLGISGSCNEFNYPNEECYHIQVLYRDECIANFSGDSNYVIDDDKYILYYPFPNDVNGSDFIIYMKRSINKIKVK